jgi:hypothetical protein
MVAAAGGDERIHAWPVLMTACSWRRIAAAIMAWAWVTVSLFYSRLVRCTNRAA